MANDSVIKKIFSLSPMVEILFRNVYWKNVGWLSRIKKKFGKKTKTVGNTTAEPLPISWRKIKEKITSGGVGQGDLLLVHSAFQPLKDTQLSPVQIIDELLDIVGSAGTLAMPAMPIFRNDVALEDYLNADISDRTYLYKVAKTPIKTGALPKTLSKKAGAVRSPHPINTMVAAGPLADFLMQGNIDGDSPLPCGNNSSWKRCADKNAWIVGLGVDLSHSLTMIHVAEDMKDGTWPILNWYRDKHFKIEFEGRVIEKTLRERQPRWGALHFAERTLCKDLINSGLMKSYRVDGVIIEMIRSNDLLTFLEDRNLNGYPYFGVPSEDKRSG
jgi:aminoglycoside 3-N-acetyltransferase